MGISFRNMEFCALYLKWRQSMEVLNRHFISCKNERKVSQSHYYNFYVDSMNSFEDCINSFQFENYPCSIQNEFH